MPNCRQPRIAGHASPFAAAVLFPVPVYIVPDPPNLSTFDYCREISTSPLDWPWTSEVGRVETHGRHAPVSWWVVRASGERRRSWQGPLFPVSMAVLAQVPSSERQRLRDCADHFVFFPPGLPSGRGGGGIMCRQRITRDLFCSCHSAFTSRGRTCATAKNSHEMIDANLPRSRISTTVLDYEGDLDCRNTPCLSET